MSAVCSCHNGLPIVYAGEGYCPDSGVFGELKRVDVLGRVKEFHDRFDIETSSVPSLATKKVRDLRFSLIKEELKELGVAYKNEDLEEVADALGDLLYVVAGAFLAHGLDMYGIFNEIHRSNMTKVGGHRSDQGKWIKPDSWDPPNLKKFINEQDS